LPSEIEMDLSSHENPFSELVSELEQARNFASLGMRMSSSSSSLLNDLQSDNEMVVLNGLVQLASDLSMVQEDTIDRFQLSSLIPALIDCLRRESMADIMLHAAICLHHIMDTLPPSAGLVVKLGGVAPLVEKLQNLEYIDIAEHALRALEQISVDHGSAILQSGGLNIMMNYFDFFESAVRRTILSIVVNCGKHINDETTLAESVLPIVPTFTNFMKPSQEDMTSIKLTCKFFSNLVSSLVGMYKDDIEKLKQALESMCKHGLLENAFEILNMINHDSSIPEETYVQILKLLGYFIQYSGDLTLRVIHMGIIKIINATLQLESDVENVMALGNANTPGGGAAVLSRANSTSVSASHGKKSFSQIYQILSLLKSVLPVAPDDYTGSPEMRHIMLEKIAIYENNPELLGHLMHTLFPTLFKLYGIHLNVAIRHSTLDIIETLLHFSTPDFIHKTTRIETMCNLILDLLTGRDFVAIQTGLNMVISLSEKLYQVYHIPFVREGIIEEVKKLTTSHHLNELDNCGKAPKRIYKFNRYIPISNWRSSLERPHHSKSSTVKRSSLLKHNVLSPYLTSSKYSHKGSNKHRVTDEGRRAVAAVGAANGYIGSRLNGKEDENSFRTLIQKTAQVVMEKYFFRLKLSVKEMYAKQRIFDELKNVVEKFHILHYTNDFGSIENFHPHQQQQQLQQSGDDTRINFGEFNVIAEMIKKLAYCLHPSNTLTDHEFLTSGVIRALVTWFVDDMAHFPNSIGRRQSADGGSGGVKKPTRETICRAWKKVLLFMTIMCCKYPDCDTNAMSQFILRCHRIFNRIEQLELELFEHPMEYTEASSLFPSLRTLTSRVRVSFSYKPDRILKRYEKMRGKKITKSTRSGHDATSSSTLSALYSRKVTRNGSRNHSSISTVAKGANREVVGQDKEVEQLFSDEYMRKHELFKSIGSVAFSIEQYTSLKILEHYLLKKIDMHHGEIFTKDDISPVDDKLDPVESETEMERLEMDLDDELEEQKVQIEEYDQSEELFDETGMAGILKNHPGIRIGDEIEDDSLEEDEEMENDGILTSSSRFGGMDLDSRTSRRTSRRNSIDEEVMIADRYHAPKKTAGKQFEIDMYYNGERVDKNMTVIEFLQQHVAPKIGEATTKIDSIHGLEFRLVEIDERSLDQEMEFGDQIDCLNQVLLLKPKEFHEHLARQLDITFKKNRPESDILKVLKLIHTSTSWMDYLTTNHSPLYGFLESTFMSSLAQYKNHRTYNLPEEEEFINPRVGVLLTRQISDPLALCSGLIPDWCKKLCITYPFLVPSPARINYFRITAFGVSRGLPYLINSRKTNGDVDILSDTTIAKVPRQKLRVKSREDILNEAIYITKKYAGSQRLLEFEFKDEVGTGLGPTLEFYSTAAQEVKNPKYGFFRRLPDLSLYPAVFPLGDEKDWSMKKRETSTLSEKITLTEQRNRIRDTFFMIGALLARSLIDGRLIDLPFSPVFWKLLLGESITLDHLQTIDPEIWRTLKEFRQLAIRREEIMRDTNSVSEEEREVELNKITYRGARIEDLCLTFTLPGDDSVELKENGINVDVTLRNLSEFIDLTVNYILIDSIKPQLYAFRLGFEKVFSLTDLHSLKIDELQGLFCGNENEDWTEGILLDNIIPNYGYDKNSPEFLMFIQMLQDFNVDEKRQFLQFVTGAPRLPYGGFKALTPKLTVVKKQPDSAEQSADAYLPSVMTCQNYIKLPEYSTLEIMKAQFYYAVREGQSRFHLS